MSERPAGHFAGSRRANGRDLTVLLLAAVLATCTTDRPPTGPGGDGRGYLSIRPVLVSPVNLSSFGFVIDSVRIAAIRPVADTVVDTTVYFDPNSATLKLSLTVPLQTSPETFYVLLQLRSGTQVLYGGVDTTQVSVGAPDTSSSATVTLKYVGPGAGLTSISISPRDSVVTLLGTKQFRVSADSNGKAISTFFVSWSTTDMAAAPIDSVGLLHAPATRARVFVRAVTPDGVVDSTPVTFIPVPTAVAAVSGDGQSAVVGTRLSLPLSARVTAADNLGVKGIPVRFAAVTGGGSVRDSVVITDSLGFAEDSASLGTLAGPATFQASVTGLPSASFSATGTAGAISAARSLVTVSAPSLASGSAATLTLQAKDAFGNDLTSGGAVVVFTATGGTSTGAIGSTSDNGNGTYTATFTGILAGSPTTIGATIGGTAVTTTLPTLSVTAGAVSAATSVVTVSSPSVVSGASVTLTLQARDAAGNALTTGGATVAFSRSGGTSTGAIGTATDHGDGTYTATFTGALAGTATTIGATINGVPVTTALPTVAVTAGAISASTSVVTTTSGTVAAGAVTTLTLQAKDAAGNALTTGGATVVFTAAGGTSVGTITPASDHGDGTYSATFTGVTAGTATTVGATVNGTATASSVAITVVPGNAVTAQSVITVSASTVAAGGTATLTLQAKDSLGNNLTTGGLVVVFTHSGGTSTGTIGSTTDHANGTYTAIFTAAVAGTPTTIGATIGGQPVTSTLPTIAVIAGAISTATSVVSVSPSTIPSGTAATLTLQAKDAVGNNLTTGGSAVVFSFSGGTSTGVISATTDHNDGTYTATFTGVVAGTATTIGATIAGTAVTSTLPTLAVTPGAISVTTSVVTVSDSVVQVGSPDTLFLRAKDAAGNLLTTGGAVVLFTQSAGVGVSVGTISATSDLGNGQYRALFTGSLSGTPATIGATIGGVAVSTTPLPTIRVAVTTHTVDITADSIWTAAASPHIVSGYLRVRNAATLTIQAGAVVKFDPGSGLQVGDTALNQAGGLVLDGTTAPILLTANTATPTQGFWKGIEVQRSLPVTPWRRVTMEYGGGTRAPFGSTAAEACVLFVNRSGAEVDLDSVRIRQCNHAGIHHFGGATHVHRSEIDTVSGSAIHADFDARLELDSTVLRGAANDGLEIPSPLVKLLPSSGNAVFGSGIIAMSIQSAQLPGMLRQDTIGGNAANIIEVVAGAPVDTSFTLFRQPRGLVFGNDFDYRISGLLRVSGTNGPTITLDSNAVVRFLGQSGLVIGDSSGTGTGLIRSLGGGRTNAPVLTSIDVPGSPGEWLGVEIGRLAAADTLRNVHLEFAGDSLPGRTIHRSGLWVRNAGTAGLVLDSLVLVGNGLASATDNSAGLLVTGSGGGVDVRRSVAQGTQGYGFAVSGVPLVKLVDDTAQLNTIGFGIFSDSIVAGSLTPADSVARNVATGNALYPLSLDIRRLPVLRANAFTGNGRDTLLLKGGRVTLTDTLAHFPGTPWHVTGGIQIDSGAVLTVAPGDTLAFDPQTGIVVGATAPAALAVAGTSLAPILLTSTTAPLGPSDFGWGGIEWRQLAPAGHVFAFATVDRAGYVLRPICDCSPIPLAALRFADTAAATSVNLTLDHVTVRRSQAPAIQVRRVGTGTIAFTNSQFYANDVYDPMISAFLAQPGQLSITGSDLYHYRQWIISESAPFADSLIATNNWWGDALGPDVGFAGSDSLGRAALDGNAVQFSPFRTTPAFAVGPAAAVVATQDTLLSPALSTADSIRVRAVDAFGRGVAGIAMSWSAPSGTTISPIAGSGDAGGRFDAQWQFTNSAGTKVATASGSGLAPAHYVATVQAGLTTAVSWALDGARSQGVVTAPRAITFTSTNRTGVVVTHSHDSFNNATSPSSLCFADVNVSGCSFSFPAYGVVDSTHTSGGVDGDTIFFHSSVTQPTSFVLRAIYNTALGQTQDSVVVTMASIPVGIRIDRDEFTAGVQIVPDTLVLNGVCPGGQPNFYCQREVLAVVVDSGNAPVANQDAVFQWTLVPATGSPVSLTSRGTPSNDSATVTALANGFVRLVAKDTTTNNFGADTLPVLVTQLPGVIVISPDTVSLPVGGSTTFTATALDLSGDTMPTLPIHWRIDNTVNPHLTIVDTATLHQAVVRLDSTPFGSEFVTAFAVRGPGDTLYGFSQVINPLLTHIGVDVEPWAITASPLTHNVYVGHQGSGSGASLSEVDGTAGTLTQSVTAGSTISAVAVNALTNRVYAATDSGVVVLDGATLGRVALVPVGKNDQGVQNRQGLAVDSANNRVYVTVIDASGAAPKPVLRRIDGATNSFSTANDVTLPDTGNGAVFNPNDGLVYVTIPDSNLVVGIDPVAGTIAKQVVVGSEPFAIALNPATNRLYVIDQVFTQTFPYSLYVIDPTGAGKVVATLPMSLQAASLTVDAVNNRVYVGGKFQSYVTVFNGATNTFVGLVGISSFSSSVPGIAFDAGNGNLYTADYVANTITRLKY